MNILIFNQSDNLLHMVCDQLPNSDYLNADNWIIANLPEGEVFKPEYTYAPVDGVAVKGDLIPVDEAAVAAMIAEADIENAKEVAKQYLIDTDWYVSRKAEADIAIPTDILALRQQARLDASS
jgi:hypothetical protein|tara:strand:+ start:738 stop:1106 length:369 start_codon:yes stop_codon:yes gene_type:complete